jgi:hypothetical protein
LETVVSPGVGGTASSEWIKDLDRKHKRKAKLLPPMASRGLASFRHLKNLRSDWFGSASKLWTAHHFTGSESIFVPSSVQVHSSLPASGLVLARHMFVLARLRREDWLRKRLSGEDGRRKKGSVPWKLRRVARRRKRTQPLLWQRVTSSLPLRRKYPPHLLMLLGSLVAARVL